MNILIYNEYHHERGLREKDLPVKAIYPQGIHGRLKDALLEKWAQDLSVTTYTLENVSDITDEVLENTDVIIWWGHMKHEEVPDSVAKSVQQAVLSGMGAIFLHSGHHSKPFKLLMGTSCNLTWRIADDERALVWAVNPAHPIAKGVDRFIKLDNEEIYGEPFVVPEPEETVFITNYSGGEVFRSGLCYRRGNGRIFYFQPGHESYPVYHNPEIIKVIRNAIMWAKPTYRKTLECPHVTKPLED